MAYSRRRYKRSYRKSYSARRSYRRKSYAPRRSYRRRSYSATPRKLYALYSKMGLRSKYRPARYTAVKARPKKGSRKAVAKAIVAKIKKIPLATLDPAHAADLANLVAHIEMVDAAGEDLMSPD